MQLDLWVFDGSVEFAAKYDEWVNREAIAFALKDAVVLRAMSAEIKEWMETRFNDVNQPPFVTAAQMESELRPRIVWKFLYPIIEYGVVKYLHQIQSEVLPYYWARYESELFRIRFEQHIRSFDDDEWYPIRTRRMSSILGQVPEIRRRYGGG